MRPAKRSSRPGKLDLWMRQRTNNIDRMLADARQSDAALYAHSATMLDALAHLLMNLGDEAGGLYASSLARLLENKRLCVKRARKRDRG